MTSLLRFGADVHDAQAVADAKSSLWWGGTRNDALIRERFGALRERAVRGELRDWEATARGRLALILLVDQFSRNIHRGTPEAFAQDALAQRWCLEGIRRFGRFPHRNAILHRESTAEELEFLKQPGSAF